MSILKNPCLYLVTDRELLLSRDLEWVVQQAILGGVSVVQLREKSCSSAEFLQLARRLLAITRPAHVPLIINDRVDIALAAGAEGVHIGQEDLPYPEVRRLVGEEVIVGLSVENAEQAERANGWLDLDYIGASPIYLTTTKPELSSALGVDGLRKIKEISKHPVIAIGGINKSNAAEVRGAGADGVAVVSAICSAADPATSSRELLALIEPRTNEEPV